MQNAKCKMQIGGQEWRGDGRSSSFNLQFAFCNLHFAIPEVET